MRLIERMVKRGQMCVYWRRVGTDSSGRSVMAAPIALPCRWVDMNEEFMDQEGAKQVSSSMVYLRVEHQVGDMLMRIPGIAWKPGQVQRHGDLRSVGLKVYRATTVEGSPSRGGETPPSHTDGSAVDTVEDITWTFVADYENTFPQHNLGACPVQKTYQMPTLRNKKVLMKALL